MKFERWVAVKTVIIVYVLLITLQARSIYEWSNRLPYTPKNDFIRKVSLRLWRDGSAIGLESPALFLNKLLTNETFTYQEIRQASTNYKGLLKQRDKEIGKGLAELSIASNDASSTQALLIGDSNMMRLAPHLKDMLQEKNKIDSTIKAKLATGLARRDVFDWNLTIENLLKEKKFKFIFIMLGANDGQDIVEDNIISPFGETEWQVRYRRRVTEIVSTTCKSSATAVWIGLPPMRNPTLNKKIKLINDIYASEVNQSRCALYLPSEPILTDQDNTYTDFKEIAGSIEKIRADDGIHITRVGNHLLAINVVAKLKTLAKIKNRILRHKISELRKPKPHQH